MRLPSISIINFSSTSDQPVQDVIRAVNVQVSEDFMPIWGHGWLLRLDTPTFVAPGDFSTLDDGIPEPVRADGVIYLVDEATIAGALGYHSINSIELPVGFVFTTLGQAPWSVTLSHEVLEMIADPTVNILVPGPSPKPADNGAIVLHAYEVCDAVERFSYKIDGIAVSDFLTPWYFSEGNSLGTRNDFLGLPIDSFTVLPGCHAAYFDLAAGAWKTYVGTAKAQAKIAPAFASKLTDFDAADATVDRRRPDDAALLKAVEKFNARAAEKPGLRELDPTKFRVSRTDRLRSTTGLGPPARPA
jgi:hypothetical protein